MFSINPHPLPGPMPSPQALGKAYWLFLSREAIQGKLPGLVFFFFFFFFFGFTLTSSLNFFSLFLSFSFAARINTCSRVVTLIYFTSVLRSCSFLSNQVCARQKNNTVSDLVLSGKVPFCPWETQRGAGETTPPSFSLWVWVKCVALIYCASAAAFLLHLPS